MGSLFRSEEMALAQLFLQSDDAYHCLSDLGELGLVQFRDLNPAVNPFQRRYTGEIRRCDEMERCLNFLEVEIQKADITIPCHEENLVAPLPSEMIELELETSKLEREIREINANQETLNRSFLELIELKHIFQQTSHFFSEAEEALVGDRRNGGLPEERGLLESTLLRSTPLSFVSGVIRRDHVAVFERLMWRACRGNVFLRHQEIEAELVDPKTGNPTFKSVFVIFYQGPQLLSRVRGICEGVRATLYPCPDTAAERRELAMGVSTRIEDLRVVLGQAMDHRVHVLKSMARKFRAIYVKVQKMKAIYHTLNLFNMDVTAKCLVGECWLPIADIDAIRFSLERGHAASGSLISPILNMLETPLTPPTFNRVNKFTSAFQTIIDAYGVATYREINPAPFTIITFPFLFAVMFGDCGHGLLMFLFAYYMVRREKQLARVNGGEIFSTFFHGRYIILLMGIFSIYTGLIYNDCFSKSFNLFGSSWHVGDRFNSHNRHHSGMVKLDVNTSFEHHNPYPFGLDPIWQVASNKLTFTNSYKMKTSIVLGVTHMLFGIILSYYNHTYFNRPLNIWACFVPEVIFLTSIFGYLVFMIFYKWILVDASFHADHGGAESLLLMMINMFIKFSFAPNVPPLDNGEPPSGQFYNGEKAIESLLVLTAVLAVPYMLFTKPLVLYMRNRAQKRASSFAGFEKLEMVEKMAASSPPDEAKSEKFDLGDIFVHQAIHTIEFCLGCISNTASYLRLWALSLAHAELSEVLWRMTFRNGLVDKTSGFDEVTLVVSFSVWAGLTISILLIMEGLSAFLHALRLHWVEFNNKFYSGDGYKFQPFSFSARLSGESVE